MNALARNLEAILFHFAEPKSIHDLAKALGESDDAIRGALTELESALADSGLRLMRTDEEVALVTAPDAGKIIEQLTREELEKELGKAALETLAIILYYGPLTRSAVDNIRGVNSTFIIRNLLVRGLVEKVANSEDQRSFLYKPTMELFRYLGVSKVEDLPDFVQVKAELEVFLTQQAVPDNVEKAEPVINLDEDPLPPSQT